MKCKYYSGEYVVSDGYRINKKNKIRIQIALCTQTKQIVAYHIGKGSQEDCENFYYKILEEYSDLKSYSDCNSCYTPTRG